MRRREYRSGLAPYIEALIKEKQACGYSYEFEEYILEVFDQYIINSPFNNGTLSRELVMGWAIQKTTEGKGYRNQRVSFVRQLALYMISIGIDCYIPQCPARTWTPDPYILSEDELRSFFNAVDSYSLPQASLRRLSPTYSVLFRLFYCCGLRLSEGVGLGRPDIDLACGIIAVRHSKGDKDRSVFMAGDVADMCRKYDAGMEAILPNREWFFPGRDPHRPLSKTGVDSLFGILWSKVGNAASGRAKKPTVHSLRHTYVVTRMNKWMDEGKDISRMMPYLSRQLGHSSVDGTQYYYHASIASIPIIHKLDKTSKRVIPEKLSDTENEPVSINRKTKRGQRSGQGIGYALDAAKNQSNVQKSADRIIPEVTRFES